MARRSVSPSGDQSQQGGNKLVGWMSDERKVVGAWKATPLRVPTRVHYSTPAPRGGCPRISTACLAV